MIKTILSSAMVMSVILFIYSTGFAQSQPLFGPNKYIRTTGTPNTFSGPFLACNTGATYKLIVENGEAGKDSISSCTINLNGQEIMNQSDFSRKVDKIEKTVSLEPENTLDIKLASGPDGFIKVSVFCITNCLEVKITSPETTTTINQSQAMIKGELHNFSGETGVALQSSSDSGNISVVAQTHGTDFAGIVPLQQGQNTITATATDACGYSTTDTITITTESLDEKIRLTANPPSGIHPLNVTFDADASLPATVSSYSWDTNGDGTPDQSGSDLAKITASYQQPGLYSPKVTITDTEGNTYSETTVVNVLSREEMDALLKAKWDGMKTKLLGQDVEGAISYFNSYSQDRYREIFTALSTILPDIAANMQEIQLIYLYNGTAKYRIRKNEIYGGQSMTTTYYIYFLEDDKGLWAIDKF